MEVKFYEIIGINPYPTSTVTEFDTYAGDPKSMYESSKVDVEVMDGILRVDSSISDFGNNTVLNCKT